MGHDIRIRVIPKQNPDYRKLARALLALVEQRQQAETGSKQRRTRQTAKPRPRPGSTR